MEERLDKYLASETGLTRSEVKKKIRDGRVSVEGIFKLKPETKIRPGESRVFLDGAMIEKTGPVYLMMNKPAGILSSTRDRQRTVLDLLPDEDFPRKGEIFPAGRLDKDTVGLLLLTDDGQLAHELLSPRLHVEKSYFVILDGKIPEDLRSRFQEGIDIGEEKPSRPADLFSIERGGTLSPKMENGLIARAKRVLTESDLSMIGEGTSGALVVLTEGKYHQIKRMFGRFGLSVLFLKRLSMGALFLDRDLPTGSFRRLREEELLSLRRRDLSEREMGDA